MGKEESRGEHSSLEELVAALRAAQTDLTTIAYDNDKQPAADLARMEEGITDSGAWFTDWNDNFERLHVTGSWMAKSAQVRQLLPRFLRATGDPDAENAIAGIGRMDELVTDCSTSMTEARRQVERAAGFVGEALVSLALATGALREVRHNSEEAQEVAARVADNVGNYTAKILGSPEG